MTLVTIKMEGLSALQSYLVLFLTIVISPNLISAYKVYWNIPTELCASRYNISFTFAAKDYGITMNDDNKFKGNAVTILYTPGLFPEIKGYKYNESLKVPDLSKLVFINGGLPQDGDMMKHLNAIDISLNQSVPNTKNDGLIIIDMEHFGATWAQNFNDMEIYRILSRKRVQDKNPTFTTAKVEAQAKLEYERAATTYVVKTIQYAKALRPYAKWGYYQYPQCFNGVGVDTCSTDTQEDNNQLILLWKNSDALYPSAYLGKEGTSEDKAMRTRGKVRECKRVIKYAEKLSAIFPYITYKYYSDPSFILDKDLENLIAVPKEEGADGVILWGSSIDVETLEKCKIFVDYVKKSIGPISKKYITK